MLTNIILTNQQGFELTNLWPMHIANTDLVSITMRNQLLFKLSLNFLVLCRYVTDILKVCMKSDAAFLTNLQGFEIFSMQGI